MQVNGHSRISVSGRCLVLVDGVSSETMDLPLSPSGLDSSGTHGSMLDWTERALGEDAVAMAGSEQIDNWLLRKRN